MDAFSEIFDDNYDNYEQDLYYCQDSIFNENNNVHEVSDDPEEKQKYPEDATLPLENEEKVNEYIRLQKPKSTNYKESSDLKRLKNFFSEAGESREILNIPLEKLNTLLANFFMKAKRLDGKLYEPDSLSSFCRSLQRYLTENGSEIILKADKEFTLTRRALAARRKELVRLGKGNKPNACRALEVLEEEKLFKSGAFGVHDPVALQRTIWYLITLHFGYRGRDEARKLCWGDITLEENEGTGEEFLIWNVKRGSKCESGEKENHLANPSRKFPPKAYINGLEQCPVTVYKEFKKRRPKSMLEEDSPFFLQVNRYHCDKPGKDHWYLARPMGKNKISEIMKSAAKDANISSEAKKLANHSVRKTNVDRLMEAGVPPTTIVQLTGHKRTESLASYHRASQEQQRQMSKILARATAENSTAFPSSAGATTLHKTRPSTSSLSKPVDVISKSQQLCEAQKSPSTQLQQENITAIHSQIPFTQQLSALFSNVGTIQNCTFQIYQGQTPNPVHPTSHANQKSVFCPAKRRRAVIYDSDED